MLLFPSLPACVPANCFEKDTEWGIGACSYCVSASSPGANRAGGTLGCIFTISKLAWDRSLQLPPLQGFWQWLWPPRRFCACHMRCQAGLGSSSGVVFFW